MFSCLSVCPSAREEECSTGGSSDIISSSSINDSNTNHYQCDRVVGASASHLSRLCRGCVQLVRHDCLTSSPSPIQHHSLHCTVIYHLMVDIGVFHLIACFCVDQLCPRILPQLGAIVSPHLLLNCLCFFCSFFCFALFLSNLFHRFMCAWSFLALFQINQTYLGCSWISIMITQSKESSVW